MKPKIGMKFHSLNNLFIGLILQVNKNNFYYIYTYGEGTPLYKYSPFSSNLKVFEDLIRDGSWKLIEDGLDKLENVL